MLDITEEQRILTTALRGAIKTMRYLDEYANLLQEYISPADLDAAFENFDEIVESIAAVQEKYLMSKLHVKQNLF